MKTYTLKEAAKKINIAPGTLRQWETEFNELLDIPRTKQGARIYGEREINLLFDIKSMQEKKASKELIRKSLQPKPESENVAETDLEPSIISVEVISEPKTPAVAEDYPLNNANLFFEAMDTYTQNFLNEVKEEIRSVVRKEVLEEVKKEIKNGTLTTVKSISDSIYKSSANTQSDIQQLSESIEKASEHTLESLQYLSNNIANVSMETTEEIFTLSKQLSETTDELSHYVDVTNNEISSLAEAISIDREFFIEERNQYRQEITQRELAFQQMLTSFRDVAATKEKKWWKFWA
ncbi:MerR family transcriptional regulator [Neobacillus bataviensis]|uniref:MerR family transcriptional regulator n=1 Tax=Neobacillus bataviensis TaxID=220685 RepID=UPI001CC02AF2|nr:MerR family transcriptional regulator [Neobacillus bataviensis]